MIKGKEGNLLSRLKFQVTAVGEGGDLPWYITSSFINKHKVTKRLLKI
jgi:hypothetical protein